MVGVVKNLELVAADFVVGEPPEDNQGDVEDVGDHWDREIVGAVGRLVIDHQLAVSGEGSGNVDPADAM